MKLLRTFLLAAAMAVASTVAAADNFDPFSANIEENIATPAVDAKSSAAVASAMANLSRTLRSAGFAVDAVRKGEVVIVTIPCAALFAPNSVELMPDASKKLSPLIPYIKRTDNYKVIVAVHADNTGDDEYAERITADRANAIDDFYLKANDNADTGIIPYGLGADEPVAPNTGVANRAKNRRVEIYFVPTREFIDKAKKRKSN